MNQQQALAAAKKLEQEALFWEARARRVEKLGRLRDAEHARSYAEYNWEAFFGFVADHDLDVHIAKSLDLQY